MAKKALLTTDDGIYHKVKKGFLTDDNSVYRKVKKAFLTVGGVYRPCWSGGELEYYGKVTGLSVGRYDLSATTVGNYALFGGGSNNVRSEVDAYDGSLTKTTPSSLSVARSMLGATSVGNYALFGGGATGKSPYHTARVDVYDTSLTRTTTELSVARSRLGATSVGNYALFGGGKSSNGATATVDAFDDSLTRRTVQLKTSYYDMAATTIGNYALFGGGYDDSDDVFAGYVTAFDSSLTRVAVGNLHNPRSELAATTVGNRAMFAGGYYYEYDDEGEYYERCYSLTEFYNSSLSHSYGRDLSVGRYGLAATTVDGFALFGGGMYYSSYDDETISIYVRQVDAFDASGTRTKTLSLSRGRDSLAATSVGNYALFGGGYYATEDSDGEVTDVDAYVVA